MPKGTAIYSSNINMRYIADMREKALHDEVSAINSAIAKGKAEGMEKGIAEGQKIIIEKLRRKGMSEEEIKAFLED